MNEDVISEIACARGCSRGEARRWLLEEIDRKKRENYNRDCVQDKGFKKISIENVHRYIQSGKSRPPENPRDRQGRQRKAGRREAGNMAGKPATPGSQSELILGWLREFNYSAFLTLEQMRVHPRFQDKGERGLQTALTTVAYRWGIKLDRSIPDHSRRSEAT